MEKYNVIVIGAGAGGLTVALGCSKGGKKVLLIEKNMPGGECTWSGCVPSKAFINFSFDQNIGNEIFNKTREIREKIYSHETPEELKFNGVDFIQGTGILENSTTVRVGEKIFKGENIVIATGSSPIIPNIAGLKDVEYLTNENFFELKKIPESIIFIGGGAIALELAFPLSRKGCKVKIIEKNNGILYSEESEVSQLILKRGEELGIEFYCGVNIESIFKEKEILKISLKDGRTVTGEKIFISSGRKPNLENLRFDRIGIDFDEKGVKLDSYLQLKSGVYVVGDAVGTMKFSHIAGSHGETVVRNILFPYIKKKYELAALPFTVFTSPIFSRTGMTEKEGKELYGEKIKTYLLDSSSEIAILNGEKDFFLKIITYKGRILGATCIGEKSGEIIAILQVLISLKIPFYKYMKVIQAYPTYGDAIRKLSKSAFIDHLIDLAHLNKLRKLADRFKNFNLFKGSHNQ